MVNCLETLHLTGVIVEGVLELYVISDQDMMKGSNHENEVLCRAWDLTKEVLEERGVPMPEYDWHPAPGYVPGRRGGCAIWPGWPGPVRAAAGGVCVINKSRKQSGAISEL